MNDTLIGEVSGNFHLKYLTYSELIRITKEKYGDVLFHLLLPLSAIREQEKDIALNEIIQRLQQIPLFKEHSAYIGKCILNGLLISNSDIQEIPKIGTICTSNHSYRNALVYDDERQEIKELNNPFIEIINMQLTSGLISYKGRLSTEHYQLINE